MKKFILLFLLISLSSFIYGQAIDTTFNSASFLKLKNEVTALSEFKLTVQRIIYIGTTVLVLLVAFGGKPLLESAINNIFEKKLNLKKEQFENLQKELAIDNEIKTNKKILIISSVVASSISSVRTLLVNGGFKGANLEFKGIDESINFVDKDVVIFFDNKEESELSRQQMEKFIAQNKIQMRKYFYFGIERNIPLDDWKKSHDIFTSAANNDDKLALGLLNFFKTLTK